MTIFAREFNMGTGGTFSVGSQGPDASKFFQLRVLSYSGAPISAINFNGPPYHGVNIPENSNVSNAKFSGKVALGETPSISSPSLPLPDWKVYSDFYWVLLNTYQNAFNYISNNDAQAISMFEWVQWNTASITWQDDPNKEMEGLAVQAAAMAAKIKMSVSNYLVPPLNLKDYQQEIVANAGKGKTIEQYYEDFLSQENNLHNAQETVKNMIATITGQEHIVQQLLHSVNDKITASEKAFLANMRKLENQVNKVIPEAKSKFKAGLEAEREAATFKGVFDVVSGLGELLAFGAEDPEVAVGTVSRIANFIKQVNKIIKILEKLKKIYDTIKAAYDVVKNATSPSQVPSISKLSSANTLDNVEWDVMNTRFQGAMADTESIDGSSDYKTAVAVLTLYGKAVNNNRQELAQLKEQWINLTMKVKAFEAQKKRLEAFANKVGVEAADFKEAAFLMRQRYLEMKGELLVQIDNFNDAFRYWFLTHPNTQALSYHSQIGEMSTLVAGMQETITNGISHFQTRQVKVLASIVYPLTEQERQMLANGEKVFIPVDMDAPEYNGWGHVRVQGPLAKIIGLEAVGSNKGKNVYCKIVDSGAYRDRLSGTNWSFKAEKVLSYPFAYDVGKESGFLSESQIISHEWDGKIDDGDIYAPTFFTTWAISLPHSDGDNRQLDCSEVKSILLEFYAVAMGESSMTIEKH